MKIIRLLQSIALLTPTLAFTPRTTAFEKLFSPTRQFSTTSALAMSTYSTPDQPARFAAAKEADNQRFLNIESVYDPSPLANLRIGITGANRGIGLSLAKECKAFGGEVVAICRGSSKEIEELNPNELITGVEVTDDAVCDTLSNKIKNGPLDILINNAGYFYEPEEKLGSLNFAEELKMIDICALGPLRVTNCLHTSNLIKKNGGRVVMITSQGGSVSWRTTQNPTGGDYGHHMSKSAANMMSVLLSQELKEHGIAVGILHPGFNKTGMTKKYEKIWEIEGAVDASVGAKRVFHEITLLSMTNNNGKFINCEDGLEIPW